MLTFNLFLSDTKQNAQNKKYQHEMTVQNLDGLLKAVRHDYTAAKFKNHTRNKDNFEWSNVLVMDVDNDDADSAENAITPSKIAEDLPNVQFYVVYSRNHMRSKGSKPAVPRFHVFFPHWKDEDPAHEERLKTELCRRFPYYDGNCKDIARFFFASGDDPLGDVFEGGDLITDFLKLDDESQQTVEKLSETVPPAEHKEMIGVIPEGKRNATLSSDAFTYLKRYGDTQEARQLFDASCDCCTPPLGRDEIADIWQHAVQSYQRKVVPRPDYIPPEQYKQQLENIDESVLFNPLDITEQGEAQIFARLYGDKVRYCRSIGWLTWNGSVYEVGDAQPQKLYQELTDRQHDSASKLFKKKSDAVAQIQVDSAIDGEDNTELKAAKKELGAAKTQLNGAKTFRKDAKMKSVLNMALSGLSVAPEQLDKKPYILNCLTCMVNLLDGSTTPNDREEYCTKQCAVDPVLDDYGAELWQKFLHDFTNGDEELIAYLQAVCGLAIFGKISEEKLFIAVGNGANGKSTFFNTIAKVLGSYAGTIASSVLIATKQSKSAELATLKGKRFVIAAELEEGQRLDIATVKQLASTDKIHAEPKYKDPFEFEPTHHLFLYTNHLPSFDSRDHGAERRLVVLPCDAHFDYQDDTKLNYAETLFKDAGGAVLCWLIEGAKSVANNRFRLPDPPCRVLEMIARYNKENDWVEYFLQDCFEVNDNATTPAGVVENTYREWCQKRGVSKKHTKVLKQALIAKGFEWKQIKGCGWYYRLKVVGG